jgi:hypothetical protein
MPLLLLTDSSGSNPISAFGITVPRRLGRWLAGLWISAVVAGSLLPGTAKVSLHMSESASRQSRRSAGMTHRWIHFLAFGSTFLVLSLLASGRGETIQAAVEVIAIGCIVEVTQWAVYSHFRVFEWWDIRDDAIGIFMAFLLVPIARRVGIAVSSAMLL